MTPLGTHGFLNNEDVKEYLDLEQWQQEYERDEALQQELEEDFPDLNFDNEDYK